MSAILLAVDVGNTFSKVAVMRGDAVVAKIRRPTVDRASWGVWRKRIGAALAAGGAGRADVRGMAVSTVVGSARTVWRQIGGRGFGVPVLMADPADRRLAWGIRLDAYNRRDLGADRALNAAAAWDELQSPCIVADFGTANTYDAVGAAGVFRGGVIAPGAGALSAALSLAAPALPRVPFRRPARSIGRTTLACVASGVYHSFEGQVSAVIEAIWKANGSRSPVVVTGGMAKQGAAFVPGRVCVRPDLTFAGLRLLWARNGTLVPNRIR